MKLFYPRSYRSHNMWYNNIYAKETVQLPSLWQGILRLSESARETWLQILLLQKRVQIRMEQNTKRLLVWKENALLRKAKQTYRQRKEPELEGWEKGRQGRLCTNIEEGSPKLRLPWICSRASFSYGKALRALFNTTGGCTS